VTISHNPGGSSKSSSSGNGDQGSSWFSNIKLVAKGVVVHNE